MVSARTLHPRLPEVRLRVVACHGAEPVPFQRMSQRGKLAEEIQVVKIRTTEGHGQLEGQGIGSSSGVRVNVLRTAIGEGCQDAIGGSFPSCPLLSV